MKIINLEFEDDIILHCPFTGDCLYSEDDVNENHATVMGIWAFAIWDEPIINNDYLKTKWKEMIDERKKSDEDWEVRDLSFEELESFLESTRSGDCFAFALSSERFVQPTDMDKSWIVLQNPNSPYKSV